MDAVLRLFTLPEAMAKLSSKTGDAWNESMIFDAALQLDIELRAAPPSSARVSIWKFEIGDGLVKKMSCLPWALAILYPQAIFEIWQTGQVEVTYAVNNLTKENEYHWFEEPVLLHWKDVRVPATALNAILEKFGSDEPSALGQAPVIPPSRTAAQEAAILQTIREQGLDPLALPAHVAGKSGVKATTRAMLVGRSKLFPERGTVFDKAWQRLRESGGISSI